MAFNHASTGGVIGRTLMTKQERDPSAELVLDDGTSIVVSIRDGVINIGCTKVTKAAWELVKTKIAALEACSKMF